MTTSQNLFRRVQIGCDTHTNLSTLKLRGLIAYLSGKPRHKGNLSDLPTGLYPWEVEGFNDLPTATIKLGAWRA